MMDANRDTDANLPKQMEERAAIKSGTDSSSCN